MSQLGRTFLLTWALCAMIVTGSISESWAAKKGDGFKFPPINVPYFQYKKGQAFKKDVFQFKTIVGKMPFALFYFLPQHPHSVTELKAFAMAAQLFKGRMKFMAVTKAQSPQEAKAAYEKMKALRLSVPVILDEKGLMAYVMLTRRVPSYSVVTKKGYLKLARASQLSEKVTPSDTLLSVLTTIATGKEVPFIRAPGYTPNPYNLINKQAPRFRAAVALGKKKVSLSSVVKKKKPILLVFWSITCPHCQKTLPVLERYVETKRDQFQTISVVIANDKKRKDLLKEFVTKHKITSTILNDPKGEAFNKYRIMTVPTLYVLRPNGEVHYTLLGGGEKVGDAIGKMMASLKQHQAQVKARQKKAAPQKAAPKKAAPKKAAPKKAAPAKGNEGPPMPPKARKAAPKKASPKKTKPASRPAK